MANKRIYHSVKLYFPKVAPLPSSKIAIPNFLPTTERLGDVDTHIRKSFEEAVDLSADSLERLLLKRKGRIRTHI